MPKPFFIAHATNDFQTLEQAFENNADFAEIDIWKAPLRKELTVKHQPIIGGLGLGKKIQEFFPKVLKQDGKHSKHKPKYSKSALRPILRGKDSLGRRDVGIYFDLKWGAESGLDKLIKFLKKESRSNFIISSTDWYALLWANEKYGIVPHFTIANVINLKIFKLLYKTRLYQKFKVKGRHGISIRGSILSKKDAEDFKNHGIEIVAWTLQTKEEVERAIKLGVWGITVSDYSLISDFKNKIIN